VNSEQYRGDTISNLESLVEGFGSEVKFKRGESMKTKTINVYQAEVTLPGSTNPTPRTITVRVGSDNELRETLNNLTQSSCRFENGLIFSPRYHGGNDPIGWLAEFAIPEPMVLGKAVAA